MNRERIITIAIAACAIIVFFFLGRSCGGSGKISVHRHTKIFPAEGKTLEAESIALTSSGVESSAGNFSWGDLNALHFSDQDEKNEMKELSASEKKFVGNYTLVAGTYRGRLQLYGNKRGNLSGNLVFTNWGKGRREALKKIRVSGAGISFERSCSGAECARIGTTPFTQEFRGELKSKVISGQFTGNRTSGTWKAY